MKVGIVTQSYLPYRGGVSEHVHHLGLKLKQAGHDAVVITGHIRNPENHGLRVIRLGRTVQLNMNGATVFAVAGLGLPRAFRRITQSERFDLLHVHSPLDPFLPLIAVEQADVPVVGTFHTFRQVTPNVRRVARPFRRRMRRGLDRLAARIAVSASAASYVENLLGPADFKIIPNGVDTERFAPSIEPFPQYRDGVLTILFVGRMDPRKGARFLFQAMPYLERSLKNYRLLVVGRGWRRKVFAQFIPAGLERRVVFAGEATTDDLPRYFRSADIYCSPATGQESFGIVLLESMSSGTPVVASDIDGYRHVVRDGVDGLLAKPRDPADLASRIIQLARDRHLQTRLSSAGRARALEFDWSKVAERVLDVYSRVG